MSVRRKRALLAQLDGQLAAMKEDEFRQRRWRRIGCIVDALRQLPRDAFEAARLAELQRQIAAILKASGERCAWFRLQRLTLARADCVIWQMYLRRHDIVTVSPGLQWPPRIWSVPADDAARANSAVI